MNSRLFIAIASLILAGCGGLSERVDPGKITSINILDRNGLSETISAKGRLSAFDHTDFLGPQPYQKVMRVYGREKNGDVHSCITSYHPNGQVKQYLEAVNNRAFGTYKEWFANGTLKIDAHVIGGIADINTAAEESFLFEGTTHAFDEDGNLVAQIAYSKGELQGESFYFHPNKSIWKSCPYEKNLAHGVQKIFLEDGTLFQTTRYVKGVKEGLSIRYWQTDKIAYQEEYDHGDLREAAYLDKKGACVAEIHQGNGQKAVFGKNGLMELQEFRKGKQEGKVVVFDEYGTRLGVYSMKLGEKQGEEIGYFPGTDQPRLLLCWQDGFLHGTVKTWYENGQLESQREIADNKKNGFLTAWYQNGALMLVEEYENDQLLKGEYFRMSEKIPVSKVDKGKGIATLFNSDGIFSKKIYYQEGKPLE